MRKSIFVATAILLFVLPLLAKEPDPSDFPLQFFVRQANAGEQVWIQGQDSRQKCYMILESGNMRYSVSRRAPTAFQGCRYFIPGQSLNGRRKGGTIELLFHDKGKDKTQKWSIENEYTVQ
jgi:hypothetical protein